MQDRIDSDLVLLEKLEHGPMSDLFRAQLSEGDQPERIVAVQRLSTALTGLPEFNQRFQNQVSLAAGLEHPHIARILKSGKVGRYICIIMEFVDGKSLAALLHKAAAESFVLPIEAACRIVIQAAGGLHYAHTFKNGSLSAAAGVIHGDINPSSIIISYQGQSKIINFGVGSAVRPDCCRNLAEKKATLHYCSPEQIAGEEIDARSDIFSLGTVFFELLSGKKIFLSDLPQATAAAVAKSEVPQLPGPAGDYQELGEIIQHCLAADYRNRFQTAEQLYQAVSDFQIKHFPQSEDSSIRVLMQRLFGSSCSETTGDRIPGQSMLVDRNQKADDAHSAQQGSGLGIGSELESQAVGPIKPQRFPRQMRQPLFFVLAAAVVIMIIIGLHKTFTPSPFPQLSSDRTRQSNSVNEEKRPDISGTLNGQARVPNSVRSKTVAIRKGEKSRDRKSLETSVEETVSADKPGKMESAAADSSTDRSKGSQASRDVSAASNPVSESKGTAAAPAALKATESERSKDSGKPVQSPGKIYLCDGQWTNVPCEGARSVDLPVLSRSAPVDRKSVSENQPPPADRQTATRVRIKEKLKWAWEVKKNNYELVQKLTSATVSLKNFGSVTAQGVEVAVIVFQQGRQRIKLKGPANIQPRETAAYSLPRPVIVTNQSAPELEFSCHNCRK